MSVSVRQSPRALATTAGTGIDVLSGAVLALVLAVIGTAADHWPPPVVPDEFSLLLGGQTMALGHLANPAHAMPEFFSTLHVLQDPTYASKYLPGHSLFLAIGLVLTGSARAGQWLAFSCMGASLLWMLRAWVPRRAALAVGALAILTLADTVWASGYWGASLSVAAGALVIGAIPRLSRDPRITTALLLGLGIAGLELTRPWEGFWMALPAGVAFVLWVASAGGSELRLRLRRVVLPTTLVALAGVGFLSLHNRSVTGSWFTPAYTAYEASASGAPPFIWQKPRELAPGARVGERLRSESDLARYTRLRTAPVATVLERANRGVEFYGGWLIACTLLFVLWVPRRREYSWPAASVVAALGATTVSSFFTPHYFGPAIPPLLVLVASGGAALASKARLPRAITISALLVVATAGALGLARPTTIESMHADPTFWARQRAVMVRNLECLPGEHLIFVRYGASYRMRFEWVYNEADLKRTRVMWAHDLGDERNAALMSLEPQRAVWLLELGDPDGPEPALVPHGQQSAKGAGAPGKSDRSVLDPGRTPPTPRDRACANEAGGRNTPTRF